MLRERAISFSIFSFLMILGMAALMIFLPWGLLIPAAMFILLLIILLFLIRIDIAFYIVVILWMMQISAPLGIASPFGEGETADLPLYQVFAPLLGLCLMLRIMMRKENISNSPLTIPLLVWFSLITLTYFRNPLFLGDLFGKSGTGTIYHTIYPLFLCAIFYLSTASILKIEDQVILISKIVFIVMVLGMVLMIFMFLTGWNIPFISGGRTPWSIGTRIREGDTVYRIMALSRYSADLFLVLICFGSNLPRLLQVLISVILAMTLVIGGGRTPLVMICIFSLLSFIIQSRARELIGCLIILLVVFFIIVSLLGIDLPYTTQRLTDFSTMRSMDIGGRIAMAKMSWEAIKRRPFIGYGYGTLWKYFPYFTKQVVSGHPHSGFLSIMTAYGIVGLGIFLWVLLTTIKTGWWLYKNIEERFMKQLMLWITLHLCALLVMFFISAQIEKNIFVYLEMGIISSVYSIFVNDQFTYQLGNGEQLFSLET